jgi:hypothetical protein
MRKHEAKELARGMTWGQVVDVMRTARENPLVNWAQRSVVNKSLSKGVIFNINWKHVASKPTDECVSDRMLFVAANILREFGKDAGIIPMRSGRRELPAVHHEPPMEIGAIDG